MTGVRLQPWRPTTPLRCPGLTAVILTRDEETNLPHCLASLGWCESLLVLDSGSADGTADIAREAGARVVTNPWPGFPAQRNKALELVQTEWTLFIDADEWVSEELALEITRVVASEPPESGFWCHRRLVWQGEWIRHCGWYPGARLIRLMRTHSSSYDDSIGFSEHAEIRGTVGRLQHDLVDEDRKGLTSWLAKHVGYAELEARRRLAPPEIPPAYASRVRYFVKDRIAPRVPARPLATFIYMYVLRGGFLDGSVGLKFCLMHAWFQLSVEMVKDEQVARNAASVGSADASGGSL